jgi:hypothetical protein
MAMQIPPSGVEGLLRKSLFWDANPDNISLEKDAPFIIERVLERGNTSEWILIKEKYGLDLIKKEALKASYLTKQTLYFCSVYFSEPFEKFRSWQKQMELPEHMRWIY